MSKQITVFILKAYNIRKRDFMLVGATGFIRFSGWNPPPGGLLPLGLPQNLLVQQKIVHIHRKNSVVIILHGHDVFGNDDFPE